MVIIISPYVDILVFLGILFLVFLVYLPRPFRPQKLDRSVMQPNACLNVLQKIRVLFVFQLTKCSTSLFIAMDGFTYLAAPRLNKPRSFIIACNSRHKIKIRKGVF